MVARAILPLPFVASLAHNLLRNYGASTPSKLLFSVAEQLISARCGGFRSDMVNQVLFLIQDFAMRVSLSVSIMFSSGYVGLLGSAFLIISFFLLNMVYHRNVYMKINKMCI